MRPQTIQVIQNEMAIVWDDGVETYLSLEKLRRDCPCAACKGEKDIMGNVHKPYVKPYKTESFQLKRFDTIGGYALHFVSSRQAW